MFDVVIVNDVLEVAMLFAAADCYNDHDVVSVDVGHTNLAGISLMIIAMPPPQPSSPNNAPACRMRTASSLPSSSNARVSPACLHSRSLRVRCTSKISVGEYWPHRERGVAAAFTLLPHSLKSARVLEWLQQ